MAADGRLLAGVLGRAALGVAPLVLMIGLQVWLVDAPVRNDLGFGDGLLHGVITPVNAVRWLLAGVPIKDFASGWGYELGWVVGFVGLLSVWQTGLQVCANALVGRSSPFDRAASGVAAALLVALVVCGGGLGGSATPPVSEVPPLWNLVPGAIRHGGMACAGLLVAASSALAGLGMLIRR